MQIIDSLGIEPKVKGQVDPTIQVTEVPSITKNTESDDDMDGAFSRIKSELETDIEQCRASKMNQQQFEESYATYSEYINGNPFSANSKLTIQKA